MKKTITEFFKDLIKEEINKSEINQDISEINQDIDNLKWLKSVIRREVKKELKGINLHQTVNMDTSVLLDIKQRSSTGLSSGNSWDQLEDVMLATELHVFITQIAVNHKRSIGAIESRLKQYNKPWFKTYISLKNSMGG